MSRYLGHTSPRALETVKDPLRGYPAYWELMRWYRCLRKYPYPSEIVATLLAETRPPEYRSYPCPVDPTHWHIGRSQNKDNPQKLIQRAKRSYRKAVRDEIWAEYERRQGVVREEEKACV